MNKAEFLLEIARGIAGMPREDVDRWLEYYTEMLEDRIEEGMSEAEAVAALGEPGEIVKQILSQTPLTRLIKNKVKPKRRLRVWEIILIVLGSPIWLSVALALAAVFFSVYVTLWSCVIVVYAVELSFALCLPLGIFLFGIQLWVDAPSAGILMLGAGLLLGGLSVFGLKVCKWLTRAMLLATRGFGLSMKLLFVGKGGKK